MSNLEFSWSFEPKFETQNEHSMTQVAKPYQAPQALQRLKRKRFDDTGYAARFDNGGGSHAVGATGIRKVHKIKRAKNAASITGKQLPLNRVIDLLDKQQLASMMKDLISAKPELNQVIYNDLNSDKFGHIINPNVDKSIEYLGTFLQEKIMSKLPYKVEQDSEYSYLRVQKNLMEFYTCLSDFILHYLPPRETNFDACLRFLQNVTEIVHKIPKFKIESYQTYHFTNIYDQLSSAWCNFLNFFFTQQKNETHVFNLMEFGILDKMQRHCRESECDKFDKVLELVDKKLQDFKNNGGFCLRHEEGVAANFSMGNNPMNSGYSPIVSNERKI